MKESTYYYVFRHKHIKAKLKFESTDIDTAIEVLSTLVVSVIDWDMKRYKNK